MSKTVKVTYNADTFETLCNLTTNKSLKILQDDARRKTGHSKDDAVLLEKFKTLSLNSKRLCLAFMDLLSDDFQNL